LAGLQFCELRLSLRTAFAVRLPVLLLVADPLSGRLAQTALQAMIETIEKNAPGKNKRRLRFEIQTVRPAIPVRPPFTSIEVFI